MNFNSDGVGIPPFWTDDGPFVSDFPHDPPAVQKQLALSGVTDSFLMNGFVRAFEDEFHTSVDKPPVMGLLRPSAIPTMGALASHYTVCDRAAFGAQAAPAGPTTTPIPGNSKLQTAFQGAIHDLVNQHSIEALAKFPELKGH